jgi:flagellar motor switch protein FliM
VNRQLSQQEIDAVFRNLENRGTATTAPKAIPFDFRRLDRIPKSQLRAIRLLHDNFVRNLASSLSAYLRSYLTVNLVSVEQLSYGEFLEGLATPSCLVCLGLKPYERNAVLELNPGLTFQILEIILGGKGKSSTSLKREITEIEQHLLEGFLRILLHDLKEAWETVTTIDFTVESLQSEPQFLQVLDPGEAFVAVGIEMRIGDTFGMMNLAFPSLVIKMMRAKFDHQWSLSRTRSNETEQERMLRLIKPAVFQVDVRLLGPALSVKDVLSLDKGDVLPFDYPLRHSLDCLVNGQLKLRGRVVTTGNKRAVVIENSLSEPG